MKVLVINAGSSSLKYQLFDMADEKWLCKGNCEKIGQKDGLFKHVTQDGRTLLKNIDIANHLEGFNLLKSVIISPEYGVISSLDEISAIGHRVVQGGNLFSKSVIIDDSVKKGIESLIPLAPLHNKPQLDSICACIEEFGENILQCAVFDTAFHSTMPERAYLYAIPYKYYEKYSVRKYGFHGTSHKFISDRCAELSGRNIEDLKIITCHIGNGSSIAAIERGRVVDTSMGMTPLDGFMMGTRSGSLDPSVVTFLMEKENLSPREMDDILNKSSGLLGISGVSSDDRVVSKAEDEGNSRAMLAKKMLGYQVIKTVGSYIAAMNGVDSIVFTAGIGENSPRLRKGVCDSLGYMGTKLDYAENDRMVRNKEGKISTAESKVDVWVIPTNEELVIARDVNMLIKQNRSPVMM